MDKRFLSLYNEELQFVREQSAEFAAAFPKIAGRLALDREGKEVCADPFVERLIEGFAFLTARVRHKFDAEFPRFTQSLLDTIYPQYLSPTPAMLVARFDPDLSDGALLAGYHIPRNTLLRALPGKNERTACEFRTGHHTTLWPLRLAEAQYYTRNLATLNLNDPDLAGLGAPQAALRLRFEITAGGTIDALKHLPHLDLYIRGNDEIPSQIYEQLVGRQVGAFVRPVEDPQRTKPRLLDRPAVRRVGLEEDEALLPPSPRTFEGYRLLKEYFAFPQRFLFVRLSGVGAALAALTKRDHTSFDVVILLSKAEPLLDGRIDRSSFDLFCTPAINLVHRRADRIQIQPRFNEYQVIVDRTRPLDFEVYQMESVKGIGANAEEMQEFRPFYQARRSDLTGSAFYTTQRVPRVLTEREKRFGKESSYAGSEVYLSLVDGQNAPFHGDLRQVAVEVLATNRHLPLTMGIGQTRTDFTLEGGGPVQAVLCVSGPTIPRESPVDGETLWRLISHLSLNYHSIVGDGREGEKVPLRELLQLYCHPSDRALLKQVSGVQAVSSRPVVRRVDTPGLITFVRGSELTVKLDEIAFTGSGVFVFGAVLERFLAKYASINSFTETVISSPQRGEVIRWPIQTGIRPLL
ncbi:MAG TPA: type VI secretion system baseplate subunit TssF [Lacunisphaera sp.]|nr:type VI secretion system baseplate subunit TssF [Lacunisphaera sp.]